MHREPNRFDGQTHRHRPGRMLSKAEGAPVKKDSGGRTLIASLEHADEALHGEGGTLITA